MLLSNGPLNDELIQLALHLSFEHHCWLYHFLRRWTIERCRILEPLSSSIKRFFPLYFSVLWCHLVFTVSVCFTPLSCGNRVRLWILVHSVSRKDLSFSFLAHGNPRLDFILDGPAGLVLGVKIVQLF